MIKRIALLFACCLLPASHARTLAWDITSQPFLVGLSVPPQVVGAQFSISSVETVVSLGMFADQFGPVFTHTVRLWTDDGTLLASAVVDKNTSSAVPALTSPYRWLFTDIGPLTLDPGTYRIGVGYAAL